MKNLFRQSQHPDIKIQEIIESFSNYAIRDIRVNIENPIAAFILISCLIDQLAAFAYNTPKFKNGECYRQFITDYFKDHEPLSLYEKLRCLLVHNYSISEDLALLSEPAPTDIPGSISVKNLSVSGFLKDIEKAFALFCNDLHNNSTVRANALSRYDKSPPIIGVNSTFWQYGEIEADFLVNYYINSEPMVGKLMNKDLNFPITDITKEAKGDIFIVKCVSKKGVKIYEANLDIITQQLGLTYPTEALRSAGLYP